MLKSRDISFMFKSRDMCFMLKSRDIPLDSLDLMHYAFLQEHPQYPVHSEFLSSWRKKRKKIYISKHTTSTGRIIKPWPSKKVEIESDIDCSNHLLSNTWKIGNKSSKCKSETVQLRTLGNASSNFALSKSKF